MLFVVAILLALFVLEEPWTWLVVIAGASLELVEAAVFIRWSKRRASVVGTQALIGRRAIVSTDCRPSGQVRVVGELWQARCEPGADVGDEVIVKALDGLTLVVERS
jgi:membrane protein implicated in regulation of membrane protease activity